MLSPYRVLDVTDERGHFAGMILASLGAEVIKIEPPGGVRTRSLGPFSNAGESLTHAAYDRGKKSVVIDLETAEGRDQLRRLAAGSDAIIESVGAGVMAGLGLGPEDLAQVNPGLVYATVTAFGHDGPKSDWPATDLTVMASACTMAFTGDADRCPVRMSVPQAFHFGAAAAAGGVISAFLERANSGLGQVVDVSAQEVIPIAVQAGVLAHAANASVPLRTAGGLSVGIIDLRLVYPAKDGFVSITHVFGEGVGQGTARLTQWVVDEGYLPQEIADLDWVGFTTLLESGEVSLSTWERTKEGVAAATSARPKAELFEHAMERGLLMAPISDSSEVMNTEQFAVRGYFDELQLAGGTAALPGRFAQCSATPLRALDQLAELGEHTEEVLGTPRQQPAAVPTGVTQRPLEGLKVLDFTWSIAGPLATRALADLGATVVKVESVNKPDAGRGFLPVWDGVAGPEQSALFDQANAGKLSLSLNMRQPEGIEVVRDLVAWADVVCESYSPRVMANWGLGYEQLKEINPSIVMMSTCLTGQYGPLAGFAGYGNLGAALSGFYGLAGWPDRAPAGPYNAYTDYTSTHLVLCALLAAVDHQRRTGEGQLIDLAQAEAAMHFISPALLAYSTDGSVLERMGNADMEMAPHGGYRCAGEDEWVTVAVTDDEAWQRLCTVIGRDDLASDASLSRVEGRLAARALLDTAIETWTEQRGPDVAQAAFIAAGVASHKVQSSEGCLEDEQLGHRGHWHWLDHPDRGCVVEAPRFKLGRSENGPRVRAPFAGEHTYDVLSGILGYDAEKIADLAAAEALE